jgi:hypothetical protein
MAYWSAGMLYCVSCPTAACCTAVQALEGPGNGRVLVVDGGGSMRCALVGDALADLAVMNGWKVRGRPGSAETPRGQQGCHYLPAYSRWNCSKAKSRHLSNTVAPAAGAALIAGQHGQNAQMSSIKSRRAWRDRLSNKGGG